MPLSADEFLNHDDCKTEEITLPGYEGSVFIRTIFGPEWSAFEASLVDEDGKATRLENIHARFAVLVLADESGKRMFQDNQAGSLARKSAATLNFIWDRGRKLNGLDKDAMERLEGNSEETPGDVSSSS